MMRPAVRRLSLFLGITCLFATAPARVVADLDDYVKREDPAFRWEVYKVEPTKLGTVSHIRLTSQVWHDITWQHHLQIYEPADVNPGDAVLLFITGGNTGNLEAAGDKDMGFHLARLCGARVAVLPQVPNQPLLGGKTEDTLI